MRKDKREGPGRSWDVEEGKEHAEGENLDKSNSNGLVRGWTALRLKLLPSLWDEPSKALPRKENLPQQ